MGHHLLLHVIFIIIVIFLISFHTLLSIDYTNHGHNKTFLNQHSKRVSLFQKFRRFLPLNPINGDPAHFPASPAPAPAPGPGITHRGSPAPSPVAHRRTHPHPRAHKAQKEEQGRGKRVMTAVLASVGVTSALCAVAMFFGCRKFKKRRGKQRKRGLPKFMSSMKKVTSDPGPDLFYLKSLESAFQPDKYCLKLNSSTAKMFSGENTFDGREVKVTESEIGSERFASCREIITVHEISECVKHERDGCSRIIHKFDHKIVQVEANSDDDDNASFHSFCDSQTRLSNVSATSIGETSGNMSRETHSSTRTTASNIPPPPPLPPPAFLHRSKSLSSSSSPPLSNGNGKAPPLPSSQQVALGKDGCPLPKLKPLHWDKVRATPNSSTVWDKLRSCSFEFDEEMMESLFGYNLHISMKSEEAKAKTPSPSKHVLEPKRLHNITILSKALNVTAEQVCAALIRGEGLSLQYLEALSKMVPTKEEEAKLANYKGDIVELGHAEKLVKAMIQIPSAFARIEAMLYRETFEDELLHLKKSFSILEEACRELRSSGLFLKLLEAVLKTGNRMNMGTTRGGAKAFKLDALLKLSDVKGTDGKTTLLHFVVQEIIRCEGIRASEPDSIMGKIHEKGKNEEKEERYRRMGLDMVSGLSTELCNAKKTATIDLDVVASSVANLREGMRRLQGLVGEEMEEGFVGWMRAFIGDGERKLREVQGDEERVLVRVREITEYFHGDVSKDESNPLRIFVIVRDFLSMLDNVCKELRASLRSPNPLLPFG
ncbi:formin-like protein 11 [Salvia hispanica]|uniref:formin-like protein 11 n=1 Tax=Salvia hispanica TaxID=49212 RepID=UPI002008FA1E|nr:formin-like protein 11 [Salvia hispanica]